MPIKIVSGGLKETPKIPIQTKNPNYSEESLLGSAVRNISRLGARGAEAGLGAVGNIADLFLKAGKKIEPYLQIPELGTESSLPERLPIPTSEDVRQYITKPIEKAVLPKEYLEPQNKAEEFLDYVGSDLPFLAFGGGTLPAKIARSIGSSAGMFGAKEAGFGTAGQLAAGLIGGGLPKLLTKGRPGAIRKYATNLQKKNYDIAEPISRKIYHSGEKTKEALGDLLERASNELDSKTKKEVFKNIGKIFDEIPTEGNTSVNQIWTRKKQLNNLFKETDFKQETLRNYYKQGAGILNEFMAAASEKFPEFGKPYQSAEKLTMAIKSKPEFISLIKKDSNIRKTLEQNKLAKAALSTLGLFGGEVAGGIIGKAIAGKMGAGIGIAGAYLGKKGLDIYNLASKSPDIKKYLNDLMRQISIDDRAGITSTITRLNNSLQKEVESSKPHMKIISGGLR